MKKVGFCCISMRGGGTERVVTLLANHFSTNSEVTITVLAKTDPFYDLDRTVTILEPEGVTSKKGKFLKSLALMRHVSHSLRTSRPDILLIFGEDIGGRLCLLAWLLRVKRILTFNRGTPERSLRGVNGFLNPLAYLFADAVVVQTEYALRALSQRYRKSLLQVIPNPVPIPKSSSPVLSRKKVILNVGSIGRLKNQPALLRAFSRAKGKEGWKLQFVGDGPDRQELECLAKDLSVSHLVEFLGEQKDMTPIYQSAQVFAFTSLSEGFPNALAEGLANGCACISYDCPTGPADLIKDGRNGFLVKLEDEVAYREKLGEMISDASLRERFSLTAREDIRKFELSRVTRQFEQLVFGA